MKFLVRFNTHLAQNRIEQLNWLQVIKKTPSDPSPPPPPSNPCLRATIYCQINIVWWDLYYRSILVRQRNDFEPGRPRQRDHCWCTLRTVRCWAVFPPPNLHRWKSCSHSQIHTPPHINKGNFIHLNSSAEPFSMSALKVDGRRVFLWLC